MNVHMLPFVVFSEEKRLKKICNIYRYKANDKNSNIQKSLKIISVFSLFFFTSGHKYVHSESNKCSKVALCKSFVYFLLKGVVTFNAQNLLVYYKMKKCINYKHSEIFLKTRPVQHFHLTKWLLELGAKEVYRVPIDAKYRTILCNSMLL